MNFKAYLYVAVTTVLFWSCGGGGGDNDVSCPPCQDTGTCFHDTGPVVVDAYDLMPGEGIGADIPTDTVLFDAPDAGDAGKEVGEGEFGAPCVSNTDCVSGFCVEGVEGFVCSTPCLEECPEGWVCRVIMVGMDGVSLCVPLGANLCKPCKIDPQCGDGLCLDIGDGKFCGRDCAALQCPEGYECQDVVSSEGVPRKQCFPVTDACDCNVTSQGAEKPCIKENEYGTCLGFETCDKDEGWINCTALYPSSEDCNGIDDDCNGVADDNPEPPDGGCENDIPGVGACPGQWVCAGESGWDCVGPEPKPEECNYIDDDCDGDTDENFKNDEDKYSEVDNCGMCGNSCEGKIPFADVVVCDATKETPQCVVTECHAGYYQASETLCLPQISNLCIPCVEDENCGSTGDLCLELIDGSFCGRDCTQGSVFGEGCPEGYLCQDLGEGAKQCIPQSGSCDCTPANEGIHRVCAKENEFGTCMGTETCDATLGWVNCTAKTPANEICNGLDDDCNGSWMTDSICLLSRARTRGSIPPPARRIRALRTGSALKVVRERPGSAMPSSRPSRHATTRTTTATT